VKRILVVDDHADNRYLLRSLLNGNDLEVQEAENGVEALDVARSEPPDLVISDLLMPTMDGYTLLREWNADQELRRIPFMVYTATYTEAEDQQLAIDLGADAFMRKPAEPEDFMTEVWKLLERQRPDRPDHQPLPPDQNPSIDQRYSQVLVRKLEEKAMELEHRVAEISESKAVVERLGRLYAALSETNKAIVHITHQQALFEAVCRIAVERGGFTLAWVGLLNQETDQIELAASHGGEPGWFPALTPLTIRKPLRTPVEIALGEKRTFLSNNLLDEPALESIRDIITSSGLQSAASCLIGRDGEPIGALTLYSNEPDFFDRHLTDLVHEMAADISFALENYRKEAHRKETEEKLRISEESNRLSRRALEASANGIMITDNSSPENPIIYVNPAFEYMTGYSHDEAIGRNPWFLVGDDRDQRGLAEITTAVQTLEHADALLRSYRKDGSPFWIEATIAPVLDETGAATHFVGIMNDVTERKEYEEQLERQYSEDQLTGLASRNLLKDRTEQAITFAQHNNRHAALLFVDLDQFKRINDSLGRKAGDSILLDVASRLNERIDKRHTVSRISSDEFVVLLTDLANQQGAGKVANDIMTVFDEPFTIMDRQVKISASIGISTYPDGGENFDALLRNADIAMYRAKQSNTDTVRFYTDDMNVAAIQKLDLESRLRKAIENDEMELHYQPIVDLQTGAMVAAEALVRWRDGEDHLLEPNDFIPLAEETGLIVPLGRWVLYKACEDARTWQDAGVSASLAVNLSARQFGDTGLFDHIQDAIARSGLKPASLHVEITESILMTHAERATRILTQLRDLGLGVAIDDFGTGYSSLAYLRQFPIDQLKIDRSFIHAAIEHSDSAAIVNGIVSIARGLRLQSIAEGVDRVEQRDFLARTGCQLAQGYLFSHPLPLQAFLDWSHQQQHTSELSR
jgi:diguanylate cyclase (GGDEF)-like protein/PAS domain S-box-containing protein